MIRFSIVTVAYNAEASIVHTLDSVCRQTYPYIEHIIIDGGSSDGTVQRCNEYARKCEEKDIDHQITIVSEPDKGIYDAMNKGIAHATGDYIVFLNSGDRLAKDDTLDTVASSVGEGEELPGVLYGDTDIIDSEGNILGRRRKKIPQRLTWRKFRYGMLVCHQAFYARTDIARDTPYDMKYKYSSDVDWCIKIMKKSQQRGLSLRNVQAVTALFLDGGATTQHHKESLKERFDIMRRHYGLLTTLAMHTWFTVRMALRQKK